MNYSIFDFNEYREYLRALAGGTQQRTGFGQALATAINSYSSFVSKVLKKEAQLSLEQSIRVTQFLNLTELESHYFLLLVNRQRSGTNELRDYYQQQIDSALAQHLNIRNRVGIKTTLNKEAQAIYYSSWQYGAIHVALSIPDLRTLKTLSQHFRLSIKRVDQILEFLLSVGLAKLNGNQYLIGPTQIHLENDSPNISKHHINWRNQAILNLDSENKENLHYSATVTLSKSDVKTIKEIIIKSIEKSLKVVHASAEEEVYCLTTDFFNLQK
ncbi:MAG: TIGR02147 family protein [Bdellovibrionota bacterium]